MWAAEAGVKAGGNSGQAAIAMLMAIVVIVLFEKIDIDHEDGQGFAITLAMPPFLVEGIIKAATVGQTCQGVSKHQFF